MEKNRRSKNKLFVVITTIFISICTLLPILTIGAGASSTDEGYEPLYNTIPFNGITFEWVGEYDPKGDYGEYKSAVTHSYPAKATGGDSDYHDNVATLNGTYTETLAPIEIKTKDMQVWDSYITLNNEVLILPQEAFYVDMSTDLQFYILADKEQENTEQNRAYITAFKFSGNETAGTGALRFYLRFSDGQEGYIIWSGYEAYSQTAFNCVATEKSVKDIETGETIRYIDWNRVLYLTETAQPTNTEDYTQFIRRTERDVNIITITAEGLQNSAIIKGTEAITPELTWNNYNNTNMGNGYIQQHFTTALDYSKYGSTYIKSDYTPYERHIRMRLYADNFIMSAKDFTYLSTFQCSLPYTITTELSLYSPHERTKWDGREGTFVYFGDHYPNVYKETRQSPEGGKMSIIPNYYNKMVEASFPTNGYIFVKQLSIIIDIDCSENGNAIPAGKTPTIHISNTARDEYISPAKWAVSSFATTNGAIEVIKVYPTEELPEGSFLSWLSNAVSSFFDTELFLGVTIGQIMWFCLGLAVLFAVFKIFTNA